MKEIKWFDKKGSEIVVRNFYGVPEDETETTITIKYNKRNLTLEKDNCIIYE